MSTKKELFLEFIVLFVNRFDSLKNNLRSKLEWKSDKNFDNSMFKQLCSVISLIHLLFANLEDILKYRIKEGADPSPILREIGEGFKSLANIFISIADEMADKKPSPKVLYYAIKGGFTKGHDGEERVYFFKATHTGIMCGTLMEDGYIHASPMDYGYAEQEIPEDFTKKYHTFDDIKKALEDLFGCKVKIQDKGNPDKLAFSVHYEDKEASIVDAHYECEEVGTHTIQARIIKDEADDLKMVFKHPTDSEPMIGDFVREYISETNHEPRYKCIRCQHQSLIQLQDESLSTTMLKF